MGLPINQKNLDRTVQTFQKMAASMQARTAEACGAWGGCPLPQGHNMGRADIPANHFGEGGDAE